MRYVILRDDDTNALTPIGSLEQLYRPFLDRGLPVNLAVIPEVRVNARTPEGTREGFLPRQENPAVETVPLAENRALVTYLRENPAYQVVQHGCHHDTFEFDQADRAEVVRRLERGRERLHQAGFDRVTTFVAPHDKFSPVAYEEVARRFPVISSGWFEWRRLPRAWRGRYLAKKLLGRPHWRVNRTQLLSHPGCLLSYTRPPERILPALEQVIARQQLTVLVTHWWEYFRDGRPDEPFIRVLHETAGYLAGRKDIRVVSFDALASGRLSAGSSTPARDEVFAPQRSAGR